MAQILLVDDDDDFRDVLAGILLRAGHRVVAVGNGQIALQRFSETPYDLVISDVRMSGLSGVDILNRVKKESEAKVILITGFSHLMGVEHALHYGADGFLLKPFREEDLFSLIDEIFQAEPKQPAEEPLVVPIPVKDLGLQYCRVPIDQFVTKQTLEYDVYVKLSEFKYIKILHSGARLAPEKVEIFKNKGVEDLYIPRDHFQKLIGFNFEVSKKFRDGDLVSQEKKRNFMKYSGEVILESAFVKGVDESTFFSSKDYLLQCLDVFAEDTSALSILNLMNSHANWLYAHSLGVSLYSVMIGRSLNWQSESILMKLCCGGLFHDVGLKEIDEEILKKPRHLQTSDDRKIYESHPTRGKKILEAIRAFPDDVIQIASQHHEFGHSQGFPNNLPRVRIHPLAKVVSVANIFCELTIHQPARNVLTGPEALLEMETNLTQELDPIAFRALKSVFGKKRYHQISSTSR